MKKAIVLLLALVVVGAFAFAEDAPAATYEFSANATGGWTTNLTQSTSTFINDWDISLKFHLLNDIAKTTAGEGTYGSIEVTHINLNLLEKKDGGTNAQALGSDTASWGDGAGDGTGDNLSVTAKIVAGALEVGLYGAPDTSYENAKFIPLFSADAGYTNDSAYKALLVSAKGLSLKYNLGDMGSIKLSAANTAGVAAVPAGTPVTTVVYSLAQKAYTAAEAVTAGLINRITGIAWVNGDGAVSIGDVVGIATTTASTKVDEVKAKYLVGGDIVLNPVKDMIAITAGGWYNLDSKDMIFSATAKVTAGDLTVAGALDGGQAGASGSKLKFDASANVAYALFEKKDSLNLDFYYVNDQATPTAAPNMDKVGGGWHRGDLGLKFVDAGGLVAPLSFTLGLFYSEMLFDDAAIKIDPKLITVAESLSYKVALSDATYVKPYQALRYDLTDSVKKPGTYLQLGVEAQLFANTILTGEYTYGGSADDNNWFLTKGSANKDSNVTIKAKVTL